MKIRCGKNCSGNIRKDKKPTLSEYKELMKTTLDYRMKAKDEREKHEGNIIIYQTEESDSDSPEDRKQHDKNWTQHQY